MDTVFSWVFPWGLPAWTSDPQYRALLSRSSQ